VNGMGAIALDIGLRGAAAGLFLMTTTVLLSRTPPLERIKLLGAAMATGGAAYAVASAPLIPKAAQLWTLPLLATNPGVLHRPALMQVSGERCQRPVTGRAAGANRCRCPIAAG
jgi:hypothetical protein